jgi:hypothetical protein
MCIIKLKIQHDITYTSLEIISKEYIMSKSRRNKNEETKRRFEAIKDLMSTFAMSAVAVVAVVTLIPSSPKAEVIKTVALGEEIVYQIHVTDEDNALDTTTLFVVLENQLEYFEQSLSLGENSGYFDNLNYDTEYRLSVYGNKGFGQERLDTLLITTVDKIGATILSVTPVTTDFSTMYSVDVSIYDPNSEYSSIALYYGARWEQGTEIQYSIIPLTSSLINIELSDIHSTEAFHIYIEGITSEGTEVLDEIWVTPPFELFTSIYMNYVSTEEIGFAIYNDIDVGTITYNMNVYTSDSLFKTEKITLSQDDVEGNQFVITQLSPLTTYSFECVATYINPQTLRKEQATVYQEDLTTLDIYSYDYSVETFEGFMEISIQLNDPSAIFNYAYFESYDTSTEYDTYLDGETYILNGTGNDKYVIFTINTPTTSSYQITIGLGSQTNYSAKQVIDIIIFE